MINDLTGWYKFVNDSPKHGSYVVVFRNKRNKYMIAKLVKLKADDGGDKIEWVTEHGNVHCPDMEDLWFPFPNLKVEKGITLDDS